MAGAIAYSFLTTWSVLAIGSTVGWFVLSIKSSGGARDAGVPVAV